MPIEKRWKVLDADETKVAALQQSLKINDNRLTPISVLLDRITQASHNNSYSPLNPWSRNHSLRLLWKSRWMSEVKLFR